jgi:glycerol-3-phosphate dehydrogenase (NAD(P)+)
MLTSALRATSEAAALAGTDLVLLAVPAQTLRRNLADWAGLLPPDALLVSLMKGIEDGTRLRMSEVIVKVTGAGPDRIAGGHRPEPGPGSSPPASTWPP